MWNEVESKTCGLEISGLSPSLRLFLLVFWMLFFFAIFRLTWFLMNKYWPRFLTYDRSRQADNCSRVNSTLHSLMISPAFIYGLQTMSWSSAYVAQGSSSFLQFTLLISVAYFLFDLVIVLHYRVTLWELFTFHHIMAVIPCLIYNFGCCNDGIYILACYMLVEITNITYYAVQWMQDIGHVDSTAYSAVLHTNLTMWVAFRVCTPLYCLLATYRYLLPSAGYPKCLWPAQVCGVLVNAFCLMSFFTVVLPEVVQYWRRPLRAAVPKD